MEVFVEDESDRPPKKQISTYECYRGESFLHESVNSYLN